MSLVKSIALLAAIGAVMPCALFAQQERMYHETTESESVITVPSGPVSLRSTHDAVIKAVFFRPDSAHAVYTSLKITAESPKGRQEPDVSSSLNQPFVLKLDKRGHVQTLAAPTFPPSLKGITDLRYEFFDFFAPSPGSVIRRGMVWADTLVLRESNEQMNGETGKTTSLTVSGDTTVDGVSAWVITGEARISSKSQGAVEGQPGISVEVNLEGPEQNTFVVSKRDGALMLRRRSADLKGTIKYIGAPQPLQFEMTRKYTNEIRSLSK